MHVQGTDVMPVKINKYMATWCWFTDLLPSTHVTVVSVYNVQIQI